MSWSNFGTRPMNGAAHLFLFLLDLCPQTNLEPIKVERPEGNKKQTTITTILHFVGKLGKVGEEPSKKPRLLLVPARKEPIQSLPVIKIDAQATSWKELVHTRGPTVVGSSPDRLLGRHDWARGRLKRN